jgi:hypothetical protein
VDVPEHVDELERQGRALADAAEDAAERRLVAVGPDGGPPARSRNAGADAQPGGSRPATSRSTTSSVGVSASMEVVNRSNSSPSIA